MKTLSFISGIFLALVSITPASAYFRTANIPQGTVYMTYTQGKGIRVLSRQSSTAKTSPLPKYIVQTGKGIPTQWPDWIDPPSWIK